MKRKTWRSKLTAKERKHLREMNMRTKTQVAEAVTHQQTIGMRCWECLGILRKIEGGVR